MTVTKQNHRKSKSAARFFAVQALFQMEITGQTIESVTEEFQKHRFGEIFDTHEMQEADFNTFRALVDKAVDEQVFIDRLTDKALVEKWPLGRIDPTLRALFRAAGAELVLKKTPPKVVIVEFVLVAEAFFPETKEPRFVNAVLDHMAHVTHADSF